jgi:hypothetical protein
LFITWEGTKVRVFARKERHLSLIPAVQVQTATSESLEPGTLRESLNGWLDSISPSATLSVTLVPRLTAMDVMRVNHATIREGETHRVWPPFIFEKFWSSDVITDKKVQHYELKDANLRKISRSQI